MTTFLRRPRTINYEYWCIVPIEHLRIKLIGIAVGILMLELDFCMHHQCQKNGKNGEKQKAAVRNC